MPKFGLVFLGLAGLIACLGGAQFAVGGDLSGPTEKVAAAAQADHVNRSAKADRSAGAARIPGGMIVTQLSTLNGTSIAIRLPNQSLLRDSKAVGKTLSRPVACEAPASVLTDIAKHLESGRCVT